MRIHRGRILILFDPPSFQTVAPTPRAETSAPSVPPTNPAASSTSGTPLTRNARAIPRRIPQTSVRPSESASTQPPAPILTPASTSDSARDDASLTDNDASATRTDTTAAPTDARAAQNAPFHTLAAPTNTTTAEAPRNPPASTAASADNLDDTNHAEDDTGTSEVDTSNSLQDPAPAPSSSKKTRAKQPKKITGK